VATTQPSFSSAPGSPAAAWVMFASASKGAANLCGMRQAGS